MCHNCAIHRHTPLCEYVVIIMPCFVGICRDIQLHADIEQYKSRADQADDEFVVVMHEKRQLEQE